MRCQFLCGLKNAYPRINHEIAYFPKIHYKIYSCYLDHYIRLKITDYCLAICYCGITYHFDSRRVLVYPYALRIKILILNSVT